MLPHIYIGAHSGISPSKNDYMVPPDGVFTCPSRCKPHTPHTRGTRAENTRLSSPELLFILCYYVVCRCGACTRADACVTRRRPWHRPLPPPPPRPPPPVRVIPKIRVPPMDAHPLRPTAILVSGDTPVLIYRAPQRYFRKKMTIWALLTVFSRVLLDASRTHHTHEGHAPKYLAAISRKTL